MKSLWNDADAAAFSSDDLAMRVYTSRLLGSDEDLVMHGGGNTSVKSTTTDFFGDEVEVLYVKGSGWDLKTIEKPGFPALRLEETCRLAELPELSDIDMTTQLRTFMLDPASPSPSVEAILHAIMPRKFVDHSHTDALVTLTNNPNAERHMAEVYPDCLILPFVMPGFILAKQVYDALKEADLADYRGIVLMNHGLFTYDDSAQISYENHIDLVTRAEEYIEANGSSRHGEGSSDPSLLDLARLRRAVSQARGRAQIAVLDTSPEAVGWASRSDVAEIGCRGPITPDHVIRTKRFPVVVDASPSEGVPEVEAFVRDYEAYFEQNAWDGLQMLDPAPRAAIWRENGTLAFGSSLKECGIVSDISRHTRWCVQTGESLGGWQVLPAKDIFDLEYWSLEQAKLGKGGSVPPHQGKVALVTGAGSGIGRATSEALAADGAVVVGLDIDSGVEDVLAAAGGVGIPCDVTDEAAVQAAVEETVRRFGGLDIVVCCAGVFKTGERVEDHTAETWDQTLAVNLTATQRLLTLAAPYLKLGVDPSVLVVGSRNFPAPGPGAAAYSVSKAGLTQLARVAALELAGDGVRVNVIHPDAVFDTGAWTDEALARSAERYGLTVDEYKTKNLLGVQIRAADVGRMLSVMASSVFRATTGAQIPFDGGSDRVV